MKSQKAITMVALVVTIVIMLILAGISINFTVGSKGIITKAKQARKDLEESALNEQLMLNELNDEMEAASSTNKPSLDLGDNNTIDKDSLETYIQQMIGEKLYPVGSIYISTNDTNPSELFGGEWESFGEGRTLVGKGEGLEAEAEGGNSTVTLATENLPNHQHSIPSLDVNTWTGNHYHRVKDQYLYQYVSNLSGWNAANIGDGGTLGGYAVARASIVNHGEERLGIPAFDTEQTTITVSGQKTQENITGTTGNGTAINIQNPYIVTYMWKRVF